MKTLLALLASIGLLVAVPSTATARDWSHHHHGFVHRGSRGFSVGVGVGPYYGSPYGYGYYYDPYYYPYYYDPYYYPYYGGPVVYDSVYFSRGRHFRHDRAFHHSGGFRHHR